MNPASNAPPAQIARRIKQDAQLFGFQSAGISSVRLDPHHARYRAWIDRHYHGDMAYMQRNMDQRLHPQQLVPGTLSVVCLRMDYLTEDSAASLSLLDHPSRAYISRYALGRDYHKLIRKRLQHFADHLSALVGSFGYRVFTDSAPVLEKALAQQAGLGWIGKHSNLLNRDHGSWFFLGEIFTDLPLPADRPVTDHCGDCTACIDICPTDAIVEPYVVDARRCISYLTIEHHAPIPVEFRAAMGNRIYGCDDCQLVCPWNRFARTSQEADFRSRHGLADIDLLECFAWSEQQFLDRFAGSAIRRIGYQSWRRNIAVALGNAAYDPHILSVLQAALSDATPLLAEHVRWAIDQQTRRAET